MGAVYALLRLGERLPVTPLRMQTLQLEDVRVGDRLIQPLATYAADRLQAGLRLKGKLKERVTQLQRQGKRPSKAAQELRSSGAPLCALASEQQYLRRRIGWSTR